MPELPEVETVARQLERHVRGRTLRQVEVRDRRLLLTGELSSVTGRTVLAVTRVGKQVVFHLGPRRRSKTRLFLFVHLRMSGRLYWYDELPPATPHTRAVLHFERGVVVFVDPRRFGTMQIGMTLDAFDPGGVEPLAPEFTTKQLVELLKTARGPIKPWLLRQDRIVGLGNIYASEILFEARIDPHRAGSSLTAGEVRRLRNVIVEILGKAIEAGGTTFNDFRHADGAHGGFVEHLAVYGRAGDPCRRCGHQIDRFPQAGRATYRCDRCQRSRRSGRRRSRT